MAGVCSPAGPAPLLDQICATMRQRSDTDPRRALVLHPGHAHHNPCQASPAASPFCSFLVQTGATTGATCLPLYPSGTPLPPAHLTLQPCWVRTHCGPSSQPESPPIAPPSPRGHSVNDSSGNTFYVAKPDSERAGNAAPVKQCYPPHRTGDVPAEPQRPPLTRALKPRSHGFRVSSSTWPCTAPRRHRSRLLSSERADPQTGAGRRAARALGPGPAAPGPAATPPKGGALRRQVGLTKGTAAWGHLTGSPTSHKSRTVPHFLGSSVWKGPT